MTFTVSATKGAADAHDAGFESADLHPFVAGSATDARDVGFESAELHFWSQEVQLMLMMPVSTAVSDIHLPQEERLMRMMLGLSPRSRIFLSREVC